MTTFVSRSEWGARPGATRSSHPIAGPVRGVTFHWLGPGIGSPSHDRCAQTVRSVQRFHQTGRGWADVAYNALVCQHGYIFEGRGVDVRSAANGSTASNETWYAVCYLGGEGDPLTDAGKAGLRAARDWLVLKGAAGFAVNGHRDHKATSCPGDAIYKWLSWVAWGRPKQKDWFDMATEDDLRRVVREELDRALSRKQKNGRTVQGNIRAGGNTASLLRRLLGKADEEEKA